MKKNNKYDPDPIINKIFEKIDKNAPEWAQFLEEMQNWSASRKDDTDRLLQHLPTYIEEVIAPKYPDKDTQKYIYNRLNIYSASFYAAELAPSEEIKVTIEQDRATAKAELHAIQDGMVNEFERFAAGKNIEIRKQMRKTKGNVVDILEYKEDKEIEQMLKEILGDNWKEEK